MLFLEGQYSSIYTLLCPQHSRSYCNTFIDYSVPDTKRHHDTLFLCPLWMSKGAWIHISHVVSLASSFKYFPPIAAALFGHDETMDAA